ncbi:MAG: hypothetical protein IRY83_06520 [Chloroflexi bacterium]|nr:hypothetical protein [Chloroflexota bacterium]
MNGAALIGLLFSPLAGLMAFLITYQEYSRHFPDRSVAIRRALEAGIVAAIFFGALSLGLALLLPRMLG